jgi:hypothetical protein
MPGPHLLVIDASLDKRIATELRFRGRAARSAAQLGVKDLKDDELLEELADHTELMGIDWLLITADDAMPAEHGATIRAVGATVGTLDPDYPPPYDPGSWARDVVHRWAHVMQQQPLQTIRRYSLGSYRRWSQRRRPPRYQH